MGSACRADEELPFLGVSARVPSAVLLMREELCRASWGPRLLSLTLWYPNPEGPSLLHPTLPLIH